MKRFLVSAFAILWAAPVFAQDKSITPEALEFFEKKVRPVLVEHCYMCHSVKAKKIKGGFRLDNRAGMLDGGDLGPAIVPGQPDKSRLIEAIGHKNLKLQMPQKYKLADAVIADLTAWVKMGAPWPDEKLVKKGVEKEFDLHKRKQEHWSWQPVRVPDVPKVKDAGWPRSDIDRFLLAKLEAKGLKPASDADPRTLIRRLYLDIVGVPPPRDEVETFVKEYSVLSTRYTVLEKTVDKLLASPQFGERWGRHWLDLVRYAESRGHEFDYTIPNAFQYRDYVIRALNADVPYNQFVHEHLAGDLLKSPRLLAGRASDGVLSNESILGTGFWFLGEECHSPVDIRQDQADRFDNRIDVMTKTFLGLTVACARCHDHKFDAISTKDYYALFGILESSNYRLARFDTITHNRKIAAELAELRERSQKPLQEAMAAAVAPTIDRLAPYLLTAAGIEDWSKALDPELLKRWKNALARAIKDEASPLHPFAKVLAEKQRPVQEVLEPLRKRLPLLHVTKFEKDDVVVNYADDPITLLSDDASFGMRPRYQGEFVLGTSAARPVTRVVEHTAAERDRLFDGFRLAPGAQNESGSLGGAQRSGRTLRTPTFTLKHGKAYAYVNGNGMIYAGVGKHIMLAGPLHGRLVQKFNTGNKYQWVAVDLTPYKGQRAHLEFTPNDGADFALTMVIQAENTPPPPMVLPMGVMALSEAKSLAKLAKEYQDSMQGVPLALASPSSKVRAMAGSMAPLTNWTMQNLDLFFTTDSNEGKALAKVAAPILDAQKKLLDQIKLDSRLAPAMQDGSGTDEFVFTRGNPKTTGALVPRRFLEALSGPDALKVKAGSGRLELAQQMTDPATNPYIARVYVNRVWHHLFGRGIVASVDNFGVLGDAPTHPELLDYLADRFASDPKGEGGLGWSTKKLIRALVLSRSYQMSSAPDEKADQADPQNLLLHRMRIRRLEGEAIRDSILSVSGRLNPTMYGPAVPVFLTPFQEGRGRPGSGPLDGDGRRSIYLGVRRNFLSSFLLAFDTPSPFSTVGRRTVSNVPAQALILLNDPFVHQQADVWAKRVQAEKGTNADRVRGMYLDALSRLPSEVEVQACLAYLSESPDVRRWADLAHVLINTKEFYFVN